MKKVYVAAPLFDEMELQRNLEIATALEEMGHQVYLPQRDAGEAAEGANRHNIFNCDKQGVYQCDYLLALLDGRVPDEGTCFEMGMAEAWGTPIIIYITDRRCFMEGHLNVMLEYSALEVFHDRQNLYEYFRRM